ncbi:unnamed protein product [Kuraishia capsulata CBS 1993]|uniref:GPI transamidase component PIG-S n=1 Tax=Kuraishia capsulata CBS 1993 TaxID=1382522 RepID=W6MHB4_9ASCO|nr:uncharacterized protein KUCA_T00001325001 [Kuraishia capsulata CBS 1993]CDK25356.1 unnamed protein product [Kuraishia capsulata CBS 1993]
MIRDYTYHNSAKSQPPAFYCFFLEVSLKSPKMGSRSLPEDSPQMMALRRKIVLSILFICACIGTPIWNWTTRLYRAELPYDQIYALQAHALEEVHIEIPIEVKSSSEIIDVTQTLLDSRIGLILGSQPRVDWRIQLKEADSVPSNAGYLLELIDPDDDSTFQDVDGFRLRLRLNSDNDISTPEQISDYLIGEIFRSELDSLKSPHEDDLMTIPYSSTYHISLSLLQGAGDIMDWDVERCSQEFQQYLEFLRPIASFSLDSQVGYYASLSEDTLKNIWDEESQTYLLTEKEMSTFIDHSEWGLEENTISENVINFVVYVPSEANSPITIKGSNSNSFLVPQWGGLKIHNAPKGLPIILEHDTLSPIMEIFASQLLSLLGSPKTPGSFAIRIDILTRVRTIKNIERALNNLLSLAKLTKQLPTISIPDFTLAYVESALRSINSAITLINSQDFADANKLSIEAVDQSNRAFFEKDMIQQMYFPDEHKMAVYVPLLGPFATIIFLGTLRIFKEWSSMRKEASKMASTTEKART